MTSRTMVLALAAMAAFGAEDAHPTLAIGAQAPPFSLQGVDGKTHSLGEYTAPVLAIVFTCNHCPTAQAYALKGHRAGRSRKTGQGGAAKELGQHGRGHGHGSVLADVGHRHDNGDDLAHVHLHGRGRDG